VRLNSLGRRFRRSNPHTLVLYGKPGCHLCDDARTLLDRLMRRYTFTLQDIDITTDPALFRMYDILIPVIVVDGKHRLEAPISEQDVRRLLDDGDR
jgi:glutaredoxin